MHAPCHCQSTLATSSHPPLRTVEQCPRQALISESPGKLHSKIFPVTPVEALCHMRKAVECHCVTITTTGEVTPQDGPKTIYALCP
eukprot:6461557-Amphidinium_carterae.1